MALTQKKMMAKWFMTRKSLSASSMSSDETTVRYHEYWGRNIKVAEVFKDGFILVNLDLMAMSFKWNIFWNAIEAIGDRAIPVSFSALKCSGFTKDGLDVIYREKHPTRSYDRNCNKVVFKVTGENRTLINLKDSHWAGLVETVEAHNDYDEAVKSLTPLKVDSCPMASERQGEWYFIPRPEFEKPRGLKIEKWAYLDTEKHHTARDTIEVDGIKYVRGSIRHKGGGGVRGNSSRQGGLTRSMVSLMKVWHEVARSNQADSWAGYSYW